MKVESILAALLLAGCAAYSGSGLVPGVATEAEVEKAMGPSVDRRQRPGGETVRYYSRMPAGREMYAARFGGDGKLVAIEQRLTRENAEKLVPKQSTTDDVAELFGPPYRKYSFARLATQVWLYPMNDTTGRFVLNIEFSADGRVQEVRLYDEVDSD